VSDSVPWMPLSDKKQRGHMK